MQTDNVVASTQAIDPLYAPSADNVRAFDREWLLLLALIALVWFGALGYRPLAEPDEGRYAEIPREMVVSGDYVTPRLNGIKYFEKPAFQYWMTAASYKAFGVNEWAARLWPALTGFLGALMVWWVTRQWLGEKGAAAAALFVLSSPYYAFFSQVLSLDIGVTFFISAGMLFFMRAQCAPNESREERFSMLMAWASLALAVLSKGLIGIVLPALVVGAYVVMERNIAVLRRMHWLAGLAVFSVIVLPWFFLVSQRNPEFPEFFFIHEHFARYTSNIHHKAEPFWYFFPILLIGALPWTWLAIEGVGEGWRKATPAGALRVERFLILWAACVVGFFSISGSKLPGYVLPAVAPLAILAAQRAMSLSARGILVRVIPGAVLLAVLLFAGTELMEFAQEDSVSFKYFAHYANWMEVSAIAILAVSAMTALIAPRTRMLGILCMTTLLGVHACVLGFDSLSPLRSAHHMAGLVRSHMRPGTVVFEVGRYDQSLPFYLESTVTLAEVGGELEFGIKQEPHRMLATPEAFESAWQAAHSAIAVMDPASYEKYLARGLAAEIIARDPKRVVVLKPR
ncbi:MAG: glycosyltransferase family 39 protein [Betaproteobacteria bacterium]|nr:glycosyltransferase family 39 protein [Betaproteobacteria bacterium]